MAGSCLFLTNSREICMSGLFSVISRMTPPPPHINTHPPRATPAAGRLCPRAPPCAAHSECLQDEHNYTPLHLCASHSQHPHMLKELVGLGADIEAKVGEWHPMAHPHVAGQEGTESGGLYRVCNIGGREGGWGDADFSAIRGPNDMMKPLVVVG